MKKMNITHATCEPFYSFVKFHDALNRRVKSTAAALRATQRSIGAGTQAAKLFSVLVEYTGEPWGTKNHVPNPKEEIDSSIAFFSELGVVRVDSAIEDFLTSILDEWARLVAKGLGAPAAVNAKFSPTCGHAGNVALCGQFGFSQAGMLGMVPVLEYHSLLRNSIVHRNGRPSPALVALSQSPPFNAAWRSFRVSRNKPPPEPPVVDHERVIVLPRHVIFLSAVWRKVAADINAAFTLAAGVDGLVFLAARHSLSAIPIPPKPRTPEGLMNRYLTAGRRIKPKSNVEVIGIMKDPKLNVWDAYRQAFAKL